MGTKVSGLTALYSSVTTTDVQYGNENRQLYRDYLSYCIYECDFSPHTINGVRCLLRLFVAHLEDRNLRELRLPDLHAYFKERSTVNKSSSVNRDRAIIRSFLMYCDKIRDVRLRFDYSMIRNAKEGDPVTVCVTIEQVQRILACVENDQDRLIFATMYAGALRIGEIVKLQVGDFNGKELRVRGKGNKQRVVPLPHDLCTSLEEFIVEHNLRAGTLFRHVVSKSTLETQQYSVNGLRKRLYRILAPYGIHINPHAFRHGMATALAERGIDIYSLQMFLGHKRMETTQRYLHLSDSHLHKRIKEHFPTEIRLDNLLNT